jgi:hypothetical protein
VFVQALETISDLPSSCDFGLESLVSKHRDPPLEPGDGASITRNSVLL